MNKLYTNTPFIPKETNDFSQITNRIFITNAYTASNDRILQHHNIKHIIGYYPVNYDEQKYNIMRINLQDIQIANISQYFEPTYKFIDNAVNKNENILVHCHLGVSRASTTVIHYLMKKWNKSFDEVFSYVKGKRPIINPNPGFRKQLKSVESFRPLYDSEQKNVKPSFDSLYTIHHDKEPKQYNIPAPYSSGSSMGYFPVPKNRKF